jgi:predicted GNAT family acetyltransferase
VTALHAGLNRRARVAVLDDGARPLVHRLLDEDPIVNAVVAARVRAVGSLEPARLGGMVFGLRERDMLAGAAFSGGNLIPVGGDAATWTALAQAVVQRPRVCTSIVGRADAVAAMWPILTTRWGRPRAVRREQPLLVLRGPVRVPADDSVRRARAAELDRYLAAAAAMFTEELGVSPRVSPGTVAYRRRIEELIRSGRAFASFDFRGQVIFKADLGAITPHTCQVQGVWVRPDLRGRGVATAALATVLRHALTLAPTVSLYVNDYNAPARRVYAKLGMRQEATLSTVLL